VDRDRVGREKGERRGVWVGMAWLVPVVCRPVIGQGHAKATPERQETERRRETDRRERAQHTRCVALCGPWSCGVVHIKDKSTPKNKGKIHVHKHKKQTTRKQTNKQKHDTRK